MGDRDAPPGTPRRRSWSCCAHRTLSCADSSASSTTGAGTPRHPRFRAGRDRPAVSARPPYRAHRTGHRPNDGRSAARIGAIRRSYDDVLAEGCAALGLAELLGVLPDGPELDAERQRVEVVLIGAGMVLEDTF